MVETIEKEILNDNFLLNCNDAKLFGHPGLKLNRTTVCIREGHTKTS